MISPIAATWLHGTAVQSYFKFALLLRGLGLQTLNNSIKHWEKITMKRVYEYLLPSQQFCDPKAFHCLDFNRKLQTPNVVLDLSMKLAGFPSFYFDFKILSGIIDRNESCDCASLPLRRNLNCIYRRKKN